MKNKINKFLLVILIILISGASAIENYKSSLILICVVLLGIAQYRKIKYDSFILKIFVFWIVINAIYSFVNTYSPFSINTFTGYSIRIFNSYLIIKIIGNSFWEEFEGLVFKLVIVSLVIFPIHYLLPDLINSFKPLLEPLTNNDFYRKESQFNYWYGFFYTNTGREEIRNSGFMWEPGAYSMVLTIVIIYNWIKKGINLKLRILIYIIAILTTISTAGYLSLALLMLAYTIYIKRNIIAIGIIVLVSVFNSNIVSLDHLLPKVENQLQEVETNTYYEQGIDNRFEVNRYMYFFITIRKAIKYPFGHGVLEDEDSYKSTVKVVGVNGLGDVLMKWGWVGLIFTIVYIYKFCKINQTRIIYPLIFTLAILITFFSNPIESNPILFIVIFTPLIFNNKLQQKV